MCGDGLSAFFWLGYSVRCALERFWGCLFVCERSFWSDDLCGVCIIEAI